jgi:ABC-2 type transport system permease protein
VQLRPFSTEGVNKMKGLLLAKIQLFMRKPLPFLLLTLSTIAFTYAMGMGSYTQIDVPVYSKLPKAELEPTIQALNESKLYKFSLVSEEKARKEVSEGKAELALHLQEDDVTFIVAAQTGNSTLIKNYVMKVMEKEVRNKKVLESVSSDPLRQKSVEFALEKLEKDPLYTLEKKGFKSAETKIIDSKLQGIFGFALFFVIYTIAFNVVSILTEKTDGVWNRILLSPVKKWELYAANLLFAFVLGYSQIVIVFSIFRYVVGVHFYGAFGKTLILLIPYVFVIIALSLLVAACVNNIQQFNAVIPFISVSMAMLGGAYWPIEIVTSESLLLFSKFVPVTYGMEILKGATIYGHDWKALLYPVSILCLMGVVMMGIGANIMERRHQ